MCKQVEVPFILGVPLIREQTVEQRFKKYVRAKLCDRASSREGMLFKVELLV